jgi:threonine dehydratase
MATTPDSLPPHLTQLLRDVLTSRVYEIARETPLEHAPRLSRRLGNEVLLKREDLQPVHSFKVRGAYNRIAALTDAERARGIVAASAGNHAQGVAFSASRMQVTATIVMPETTPQIKIDAVRAHGARIVLVGDSYSDAQARAEQLARDTGATQIHPFDDPAVIAGQGTVGAEILNKCQRSLSTVFVPVGGGGLIAGIAGYIKSLRPEVQIIGVEPVDSDAMYQSLAAGRRVRLEHVGLFADGVSVREVGQHTFAIARQTVSEVVRVSNDEICAAIKDVFDETRSIMEPAGALSVAGMKTWVEETGVRDTTLVAVLSGANMNFDRLRFVAERAELGETREVLLAVTIPERRGAFRDFCSVLDRRIVTEFNYRLSSRDQAHIFVGIAISSRQDGATLVGRLAAAGYPTADLTDNETAKLHVRHMVGGRTQNVRDERICRFEFPERPGALARFLDHLGGRWNISLFHYRNHGADSGRVLAGFEVPSTDLDAFHQFLRDLGYEYTLEPDNAAYRLFLA